MNLPLHKATPGFTFPTMIPMESLRIRYGDHYEAYARLWRPAEPYGSVLYLHGIQSHGLWFEESARRLAEAGFAVLLPDRRGSGRNQIDRGHTPSLRRLLRDLGEGLDELHVRTGLSRFHIVGVSWGGKLALALARYLPARLASITLVAPGLFPRVDLPVTQKVRVAWSALTNRGALFDIPLNIPELFTTNPGRQKFIREDRLGLRRVTAGFLLASRKLDRYVLGVARLPTPCPLRLFLGGQDRIIDNERTRAFVRGLAWPDCQIIEYEHAHHTLEFEQEPEVFFSDLVASIAN